MVMAFLKLVNAILRKSVAHWSDKCDAEAVEYRPRWLVCPHTVVQLNVCEHISEQVIEVLALPREGRHSVFNRVLARFLPDLGDHGLVRWRLHGPYMHSGRERSQSIAKLGIDNDGHLVRRHRFIVRRAV